MSTKIEWKPSELPDNTIVRGQRRDYWEADKYDEESLYCAEGNGWMEVHTRGADFIDPSWADELLKILEIVSVPKSWYEEFRPMVETPWEINREGHVRNRREERGPFVRHNVPKADVLSIWTPLSMNYEEMTEPISDVVRKAFSG